MAMSIDYNTPHWQATFAGWYPSIMVSIPIFPRSVAVRGDVVVVNPALAGTMNADFDGDQMRGFTGPVKPKRSIKMGTERKKTFS